MLSEKLWLSRGGVNSLEEKLLSRHLISREGSLPNAESDRHFLLKSARSLAK